MVFGFFYYSGFKKFKLIVMSQTRTTTPLTILLADDDIDDRHLFAEALKEIPIATQLSTVTNGEELMNYLLKKPMNLPDILFLDLSMPRKTGYECLFEIKNDENLKGLHVIMFTTSFVRGYELEQNLTNTLSGMGAEDYIRKPSGFEQLKHTLNEALIRAIERIHLKSRAETHTVSAQKIPDINFKQMNILLADDDMDDCNFFKKALQTVPLLTQLTTVPDGEQLMKYLFENSEHLPHVLFLDINMPRKNGFECLSEIKQNEKLKHLPVVMFSTSNSQDNISILFKTGADLYIRKPSNFTELVQIIHNALPIAAENIFSNGKLKYIFNP